MSRRAKCAHCHRQFIERHVHGVLCGPDGIGPCNMTSVAPVCPNCGGRLIDVSKDSDAPSNDP